MGNVYWRTLPKGAKVRLVGNQYQWRGKTVYWDGKEAIQAQAFLKKICVNCKTSKSNPIQHPLKRHGYRWAGATSVCPKSSPLKSSGSPRSRARA